MACACKVNQKLDYIQKKYGPKGPERHTTHMSMDIAEFFQSLAVFLLSIILLPFMIVILLIKIFSSKKKSILLSDLLLFKKL